MPMTEAMMIAPLCDNVGVRLGQRTRIIQVMRRRFPARRIDLPGRFQLFRLPRCRMKRCN
jgi:hypothetical protein